MRSAVTIWYARMAVTGVIIHANILFQMLTIMIFRKEGDMNKRQKKKYCDYWGWRVRVSILPQTCYDELCPNNARYGDCKYKRCRIPLIRPSRSNDFNEAKQAN